MPSCYDCQWEAQGRYKYLALLPESVSSRTKSSIIQLKRIFFEQYPSVNYTISAAMSSRNSSIPDNKSVLTTSSTSSKAQLIKTKLHSLVSKDNSYTKFPDERSPREKQLDKNASRTNPEVLASYCSMR
jgi:hypothetical protein